ncbi:MAG: hypothetical protein A3F70_02780 [Acidobacteria bacterium RIFCSPLOWO2_12_FULL_67_14]|nr:MAG: hypothetical protein A3H29_19295 [Acidobacteria bacterium RIFCSPLOWO2_02_FULL_67_21]OFW37097.1 MAG: hypothetical protein A3F70_02780 [Acidobacteria bacterium RIFCSPLOWO2_12_FULL_67_14]
MPEVPRSPEPVTPRKSTPPSPHPSPHPPERRATDEDGRGARPEEAPQPEEEKRIERFAER